MNSLTVFPPAATLNSSAIFERASQAVSKAIASLSPTKASMATIDFFRRAGMGAIPGVGLYLAHEANRAFAFKIGLFEKIDREQVHQSLHEFLLKHCQSLGCERQEDVKHCIAHHENGILYTQVPVAILEELLFRGLIQDTFLKQIPQKLLQRYAPGRAALLNEPLAKWTRIILASALHSALVNMDRLMLPSALVNQKIFFSFAAGIAFGWIKESDLGLAGAVGAHTSLNALFLLAHLQEQSAPLM